MDSMPVPFLSRLSMDFIAAPRPASPTDSNTDGSSDSDYSPPLTPVDLELIPFLTDDQCESIEAGNKHTLSLLEPDTRSASPVASDDGLDSCSESSDTDLFASPLVAAIPPELSAANAAWLAYLMRRDAYLYPSRVADTTVCVYDPSWHEDSLRGYALPRVTVTGCAEDAEQWFENAADFDEGPCWDHLMVPMLSNNGRMSDEDEEFFYPYPTPDVAYECVYYDDEEPVVNSYEARWRGASLQELEDELCKQKVLVESQRVDEYGVTTYVPERVEGRSWLWKNFWYV